MDRRQFCAGVTAACLGLSGLARAFETGTPARIVSTAPSATETLFALGLGAHVVGVSVYCEFPPEVKALPKVGTYVKPDLEAITRLRPDLVVLQRHPGPMTERLDALGIRYVQMPYGTLADVYTGIETVARATGAGAQGRRLNDNIRAKLAAVKGRADARPKPRVMVVVDRRPGQLTDMIAAGPECYVNEMITTAGGMNVLDQPGLPQYPRISMETVVRGNAEVIVDLTDAHDPEAGHEHVRPDDLALWRAHPELAAVRAGRVVMGEGTVLLVPGPRSPEAAERFYSYFHGGAA